MTASRIMPYFYSPQAAMGGLKSDKPVRWYQVAIGLLIMYFFFSGCVHIQLGTATKYDLIFMVIIVIWGLLSIGQDSPEVKEAKQKWKDTSKFADVAIISRDHRPGGTYYDEYEIPHTARPRYSLTLQLPNQEDVNVDVSESVNKELENRDTVRIYYKPESPLTFALEEEL
jgi:hypothetical protein